MAPRTSCDITREIDIALKNGTYLYKAPSVNYKGVVEGAYYTEIIANHLLDVCFREYLSNIQELPRTLGYKGEHNTNGRSPKSNRHEELFASQLDGKQLKGLGKVKDYQVPLKPHRTAKYSGIGKIDIVTTDVVYIVELKYGQNTETLLRAVLEIAYYYQWLGKASFLDDFVLPSGQRIKKAVLLGGGTRSLAEAKDIANRPWLKELIKQLAVDVFSINDNEVKLLIP